MKLPASTLAAAVVEQLPLSKPLTSESIGQLGTALFYGLGAVRQERTICLVLQSPFGTGNAPVVVTRELHRNSKKRKAIPTTAVAAFFRWACRNLGTQRPKGYNRNTWFSVAQNSYAPVPAAGDLGKPLGLTADAKYANNKYVWYSLASVPVGGALYRLDSGGQLTFFQRLSGGYWARVSITGAANAVDIAAIMAGLQSDHGSFEQLVLDERCRPLGLLRQPPD